MGNQLSGTVPSQILPIEHYLQDTENLQYDGSLGSTRFFKVARVKSREGDLVIKIFVINDPSLPLTEHQSNLEVLLSLLTPQWGCLAFQKAVLTDKAALLFRQYVHTSAYDRISTRPFLTWLEKKWILYQVLKGLSYAHTNGVCHGDIKLENIMLTSFCWVLLTDFASYKPAFIPEDNPTDYTYFFDTSRRRVCYIAPERFRNEGGADRRLGDDGSQSVVDQGLQGALTPGMDIFSAGCALTELCADGVPPFTLASLLSYRAGGEGPEHALDKIEDDQVREILRIMMSRNPADRIGAYQILRKFKDTAFPDYFDPLYKYFQIIAGESNSTADERMKRIYKDLSHLTEILKAGLESSSATMNGNGFMFLLSLVTANIRSLKLCVSKINSLEILETLIEFLSSDVILDRVLPYLFVLSKDRFPAVRARVIKTLKRGLDAVHNVPRSDRNIFPDYVLPELTQLSQDESVFVRSTFAQHVTGFAEIAARFLNYIYQESTMELEVVPVTPVTPSSPMWIARIDLDTEMSNLQEAFQRIVTSLLTDTDNHVKRTLVENGISQLCVFFGKQRANDVILSHMITFLNDKVDHQLRSSFFKAIVGVAAYVGWPCSTLLKPLLQQGLSDPEEFVIVHAINAILTLAQLGLFQKQTLFEMVNEVAPFLVHPNPWIRLSSASFLASSARLLNVADVYGRMAKILKPLLRKPIISMDSEALLLSVAHEPIPRDVYDSIVRFPDLDDFLDSLSKRKSARLAGRDLDLSNTEVATPMKKIYGRLLAEGLVEGMEDHILMFKDHLLKLHKHREMTGTPKKSDLSEMGGVLNLNLFKLPVQTHSVDLFSFSSHKDHGKYPGNSTLETPPTLTMNREWERMFGSHARKPTNDDEGIAIATDAVSDDGALNSSEISSKGTLLSMEESGESDNLIASHTRRLEDYISVKAGEYRTSLNGFDLSAPSSSRSGVSPSWRPKGVLVAHLQEHKKAVNRLVNIPDSSFFLSASSDGTVKLFDANRVEANTVANRSRQTFDRSNGDHVTSLAASKDRIVFSTEKGLLQLLCLENSRMVPFQTRQLDLKSQGGVVDVCSSPAGNGNIFAYATVFGDIIGWDLRAPGTAWHLHHPLKDGVITRLCSSLDGLWLGVGTCDGTHECWDLRFRLNVVQFKHPVGCRVRRLIPHPTHNSWVISAVQGNNEVAVWDWESKTRQQVFWSSSAPLLSQTQVSPQMTLGLSVTTSNSDSSGFLLTVGTDQRVRYWDLGDPTQSYLLVPNLDDVASQTVRTYCEKLVDGTQVVQEIANKPRAPPQQRLGLDEINPSHRDVISDVITVKGSQPFVITSAMDGVIKVWK